VRYPLGGGKQIVAQLFLAALWVWPFVSGRPSARAPFQFSNSEKHKFN